MINNNNDNRILYLTLPTEIKNIFPDFVSTPTSVTTVRMFPADNVTKFTHHF